MNFVAFFFLILSPLLFLLIPRIQHHQKLFTLVHECMHAFLGNGEDLFIQNESNEDNERFINRVVAEILMPESLVRQFVRVHSLQTTTDIVKVSQFFRTSLYASAYRLRNMKLISDDLFEAVKAIVNSSIAKKRGSGGDFYVTLTSRLSSAFLSAVVNSVQNESVGYTDGFNLLGVSSFEGFKKLSAYAEGKANRQ
jgi:Zn-dependent peptidase ImmA (M78 family)